MPELAPAERPLSAPVILDSDWFGAREDMRSWRDQVARSILGLDFSPIGSTPFRTRISGLDLGDAFYSNWRMTAANSYRDRSLQGANTGNFTLIWSETQELNTAQRGLSCDLRRGDAIFMSCGENGHVAAPRGARFSGVILPRAILEARLGEPEGLVFRQLPSPSPEIRIIRSYARLIAAEGRKAAESTLRLMGSHLADLVCIALAGHRLDQTEAENLSRDARRQLVKDFIARHAGNSELSLDDIAKANGMSPRTLQGLFEEEGSSVSRHLLDLRLERALALLGDPAQAHLRIIDIALKSGFSDVSYFNRRFRARYGDTPTGFRTTTGKRY